MPIVLNNCNFFPNYCIIWESDYEIHSGFLQTGNRTYFIHFYNEEMHQHFAYDEIIHDIYFDGEYLWMVTEGKLAKLHITGFNF